MKKQRLGRHISRPIKTTRVIDGLMFSRYQKKPKQRSCAQNIKGKLTRAAKSIQGKLNSKSITRIEHERQEYMMQSDVEHILLPVNEAQVHALVDTPFMGQPLIWEFGFRQNKEAHGKVLKGTYLVCNSSGV
jgi:hypothetical protein